MPSTVTYVDKNVSYSNPLAYDKRVVQPLEAYIAKLWQPRLRQALKKYIQPSTVVCDLGCGTLEYTQYMGHAQKIYAVDNNQGMLNHGLSKIIAFRQKVIVLCEDATKTSVPNASCDIVWIVGLSEFVDPDALFTEVTRIAKPDGQCIIQYSNLIHPHNALAQLWYSLQHALTGKNIKHYRLPWRMNHTAAKHGWQVARQDSAGIFFFVPQRWYRVKPVAKALIWLWQYLDDAYWPFQLTFPIGTNIITRYVRHRR